MHFRVTEWMMVSRRRAPGSSANPRSGWLALALALTLVLGGLRAVDLLAEQPAPLSGLTPHEARLTGLVETLVGPGRARVHESRTPEGARRIFVLVDGADGTAGIDDSRLADLLEAAGMIDPLRGDVLSVRGASFAGGAMTRPSPAEAAELAAYLLLAACLLAQLVSPPNVQRVSAAPERPAAVQDVPASRPSPTQAAPAEPVDPDAPAARRLAAVRHAMSRNPSQAAGIIRAWVKDELERK